MRVIKEGAERKGLIGLILDRFTRFLVESVKEYSRRVLGRLLVKVVLALLALLFVFIGLLRVFSAISSLLASYLPVWAADLISGVIALLVGLLLIAIAMQQK